MLLDQWSWTIGEVVAPFGRVGEVKVAIVSDFPERFLRLERACLRRSPDDARLFVVERARLHKGQALLKLAGVESIDDAELWRRALVQVMRSQAVALPSDAYYVGDLVGMEVVTSGGRSLGPLTAVLNYPAHDLLVIGDAMIPAVKEFVKSVDVQTRRIVVEPPAGLLPDDEPANAG